MPSKSQKQKKQSFPFWNLLPNELQAVVFSKLDFQTCLTGRLCFRDFDELWRVKSQQKYQVEVHMKYMNAIPSPEKIEIELKCAETGCLMMKWGISQQNEKHCIIRRTEPESSLSSTKLVSLPVQENNLWNKASLNIIYVKEIRKKATLIVGKLFRHPMLDVKLLDIDFNHGNNASRVFNRTRMCVFDLFNHPLDVLVMKNYNDMEFYKIIEHCYFECPVIRDETGVDLRQKHEENLTTVSRSVQGNEIRELSNYNSFFLKTVGINSIEKVKRSFEQYIKFIVDFKMKMSHKIEKIVEDSICLRAAYCPDSQSCSYLIEENYKEKIAKLRDGIDNPKMPMEVTAMLTSIYLLQNETYNRGIYYSLLKSILNDDLQLEQPKIYEKLLGKIEWLQFGDKLPSDIFHRSLFASARVK